jgi:hypothetical protein
MTAIVEALEPCPSCGRPSLHYHREVCRGPSPKGAHAPRHHYPRCEKCHRAIVLGRHWCRPLRRSHRDPSTDATPRLGPTKPVTLAPFPVEGVTFACRVASELNLSAWNRWGRRARSKDQRRRTREALAPYRAPALPVEITVHRWGWNLIDAHDSLPIACKSVVDQVAEWLGCDDADTRVTWLYSQEITRETELVQTPKGPVRQSVNRLRITIRSR